MRERRTSYLRCENIKDQLDVGDYIKELRGEFNNLNNQEEYEMNITVRKVSAICNFVKSQLGFRSNAQLGA